MSLDFEVLDRRSWEDSYAVQVMNEDHKHKVHPQAENAGIQIIMYISYH